MELTIYIEDVQGQEALELANEIESLMGVHVLDVFDIPPYNTEMLIDSYSYSDGEEVENMLRVMGYSAVFDR